VAVHKKLKAKITNRFSKLQLGIFTILFAGIGGYFIINSFAATTSCNTTLNSGENISQAVNSVAAGGTVCLNAGTYQWNGGSWATVNKSSMTNIQASPGTAQSAVIIGWMQIALSNNLRFEGVTIGGVELGNDSSPSTNIQFIKNNFNGTSLVRTPTNANINVLFEGNTFANLDAGGGYEGRLTVRGYNNNSINGVKIVGNIFGPSGCSDGVQIIGDAYGTEISNNDFISLKQGSCSAHVDSVQLYGSNYTQIKGNYFHNGDSYIMAPDGGDHEYISNNVFVYGGYVPAVQLGSHNASTFTHNTVIGITVSMSRKQERSDNSVNGVITNNIFTGSNSGLSYTVTGGANGCTSCTNDHNYGSGGTNPITGTIKFAGGTNPTSYVGYELANDSAGNNAGSDGKDIGINLIPSEAGNGCDLNATTSNLASQVAAASAGQTICLATGNYGTWTGTNKAITLKAASGANVIFNNLEIRDGDRGFTIDGVTVGQATIYGSGYSNYTNQPTDITIRNTAFTGTIIFDYIKNGNYLLENTTHNNIISDGGRIRIFDDGGLSGASYDSGVTIRGATLDGGPADGIQAYSGFTVENSRFLNIEEGTYQSYHTDAIQWFASGTAKTIIRGNYFSGNADGIVAYDGAGNGLIEDNVLRDMPVGRCLEIYKDNAGAGNDPTIVQFNTLDDGCTLYLGTKDTPGTGTIIRNNIIEGGIAESSGSTAGIKANNMFLNGASGTNFNGTASFIGPLTSWSGYKLASGSPGIGRATDGSNVGARIAGTPTPKPGDTNGDNLVNIVDLSTLLSKWNQNYTQADFNKDNVVNIVDLSVLLSNYGK